MGQFGTSWQIPYTLTVPALDYNHPCVISYPSLIRPQVAPRGVLQAQGFSVIVVAVGMGAGMCPLIWFSITVQFWLLSGRAKKHDHFQLEPYLVNSHKPSTLGNFFTHTKKISGTGYFPFAPADPLAVFLSLLRVEGGGYL